MEDRLVYVGHATLLIELDGTRLLTDPMLTQRMAHVRRFVAPVDPEHFRVDAALISHAHHDHLHLPSIARLPREVPLVVPRGCGRLVRRKPNVSEIDVGERITIGALEIAAVPARHDGRRTPLGRAYPTLGYVISGSQRVYFAGDTDLFDGMRSLAEPQLDVALLPIWGWGSRLGDGHMNPASAARATALIQPRTAVPIHWGAYASPRVKWLADPSAPARAFQEAVAKAAPAVSVTILEPGEALTLGAPAATA